MTRHLPSLLAAILLAACAGPGGSDAPRTYDFGIDAPAARLPPLRLGAVRAIAPFDSPDMYYRLSFRDPAELLAFTESRWAAPPAELLRRQLGRAMPAAAAARCTLEIELFELSQLFASKDTSDALLEARVLLHQGGRRVAERTLRISESGAGNAASTGAAAFARAANRGVAEIAAWAAREPTCATP